MSEREIQVGDLVRCQFVKNGYLYKDDYTAIDSGRTVRTFGTQTLLLVVNTDHWRLRVLISGEIYHITRDNLLVMQSCDE